MKQSNYTVQIIEPSEGCVLTQSTDVEVSNRILSKKIFLAVTDSPSNWKEISDAEAEEIKAEQERLAEIERLKAEGNE
jgi:hypothetical protein